MVQPRKTKNSSKTLNYPKVRRETGKGRQTSIPVKLPSTLRRGQRRQPQVKRSKSSVSHGSNGTTSSNDWQNLPNHLLSKCLGYLDKPEDLANASLVCRSWNTESEQSTAWERIWKTTVGTAPLWRWACAAGGYRSQLKASTEVSKGEYSIKTLPLSHKDGAVLEVLVLDTDPRRIVTLQHRALHPQACRLVGLTLKVWDEDSMKNGTPLMVVYDVLKHFQTEDGNLVCWKIADDEIIRVAPKPTDHRSERGAGAEEPSSSDPTLTRFSKWAEDPRIRCYKVDPSVPSLTPLPLDSSFGFNSVPHEWVDMPRCGIASVSLQLGNNREKTISTSLFDAVTGRRLRHASAAVPPLDDAMEDPIPFGSPEFDACMLGSRSCGNENEKTLVLVMACLFDRHVYRWEVPVQGANSRSSEDSTSPSAAGPAAGGAQGGELELFFKCLPHEQVHDVAMSSPAARIYVITQENLYVFNRNGAPLFAVYMSDWPGVRSRPLFFQDLGAFSWPLPNSSSIAFHLEASNGIYIANFANGSQTHLRQRQWPSGTWHQGIASVCTKHSEEVGSSMETSDGMSHWLPEIAAYDEWEPNIPRIYYVSSYLDFKPEPGRQAEGSARSQQLIAGEPVVLEYTQCGRVVVTVADTTLPWAKQASASQLQARKYHTGWDWGRIRHDVDLRRCSDQYQRCIALINTETGSVFQTIPLRNAVVEAVHSAGSCLAVSVTRKDQNCNTTEGAILLIDFGQPKEAARPRDAATSRSRKRR
uniref:F-box domain-containing protein n=1 Tax=Tetraselmis sp. GSL018 TaxID=582737 RepID=A0A061S3N6_9CHLO|eukprot:CAMPEP_0177601228 /NCGR_PEP_ID=MMETSP0419_2-20121207/14126_1 /TAXON_ID=582737 /ORGANISM="Tetraselmis sp., Strain GSL018" /LENGTH=755 /DNA_ID=CAMNT_0019094437 /DNA_START=171 /DNA_END=2438 /DNA_ORIENTATION=-